MTITESPWWVIDLPGRDGTINTRLLLKTEFLLKVVNLWVNGDETHAGHGMEACGDDDASRGAMIPIALLFPNANWSRYELEEV